MCDMLEFRYIWHNVAYSKCYTWYVNACFFLQMLHKKNIFQHYIFFFRIKVFSVLRIGWVDINRCV